MNDRLTVKLFHSSEGVEDWRVPGDWDQFAPEWWTLADAAGNEADIATTERRE